MATEPGSGWAALFQRLRAEITTEQSEYVEHLRVERDLTWRGVAEDFYDHYPDVLFDRDLRGNQGVGEALCEAASTRLGRRID